MFVIAQLNMFFFIPQDDNVDDYGSDEEFIPEGNFHKFIKRY